MASQERDAEGKVIQTPRGQSSRAIVEGANKGRVKDDPNKNKVGVVDPALMAKGALGFGEMNTAFNTWKPTSDWGKMMKGTYMMNTLQGFQDSNIAKGLAATNAGLQSMMMNQAAALELSNQAAMMDVEEAKKLNVMGAEFSNQSRFAQDEQNRQLEKMGLDKDIQTALMQVRGDQERKSAAVTGYENRLATKEVGDQNRLTQAQADIEKRGQALLACLLYTSDAADD